MDLVYSRLRSGKRFVISTLKSRQDTLTSFHPLSSPPLCFYSTCITSQGSPIDPWWKPEFRERDLGPRYSRHYNLLEKNETKGIDMSNLLPLLSWTECSDTFLCITYNLLRTGFVHRSTLTDNRWWPLSHVTLLILCVGVQVVPTEIPQ